MGLVAEDLAYLKNPIWWAGMVTSKWEMYAACMKLTRCSDCRRGSVLGHNAGSTADIP